ncbi:MAG: hypothetical protein SPE88_00080, partial [Paludibacteraceae bacterium]|nr:hypothetical protein [Paludibacteraceae bacterium]
IFEKRSRELCVLMVVDDLCVLLETIKAEKSQKNAAKIIIFSDTCKLFYKIIHIFLHSAHKTLP